MWASPVSSKVIVSSQVEWTGRSFIKGECWFLFIWLLCCGWIRWDRLYPGKTYVRQVGPSNERANSRFHEATV